ncbi:LysR substrate-binding domain-containing protein [Amycolatopsis sp. WQ 127309]|uniref:LysR substrate-binding domain-containing protein n=1 Tax=Amycolatopsis sp. WQ 127309 TaxID=2932773 RepID=UPI001FF55B2A|nr:LysR substrate-binding domain-containing protein [Amycolatopsis sp. WQ 127309]UOZ03465.1 LysR substrate-binding domain-containing protein [Amycolatopsis sp. WQ 127309]
MRARKLLDGTLKLRHLVLVTAIAKRGSVLHAAHDLRISQPVVTRGLRELEALLEVELFERGPRGMTPTLYGEAFLQHAEAVLTQIRQAGRHLAELESGQAGSVTAGTYLAGSNVLLPQAISALKRSHPRVTVIVRESTPDVLVKDLLAGEIDLVVGRLTPTDLADRTAQIRMYTEPIRLAVRTGHPALDGPPPTLADLQDYPWILPGERTALRNEIEEVFLHAGLPLPVDRIESESILTLRTLVLSSDSVAVLPLLIAEEDPRLTTLPTPLPSVSRKVGATLRLGATPTPAAALMLEHLHQRAARIRAHVAGHEHDRFTGAPHDLLDCVAADA